MHRHLVIERIGSRLSADEGFTLIELLIVVQILGILIAIAAPSYLVFRDRANRTAAAANVRTLLDDVEQYNADNYPSSRIDPDPATSTSDSGYAGMTISELRTIAPTRRLEAVERRRRASGKRVGSAVVDRRATGPTPRLRAGPWSVETSVGRFTRRGYRLARRDP